MIYENRGALHSVKTTDRFSKVMLNAAIGAKLASAGCWPCLEETTEALVRFGGKVRFGSAADASPSSTQHQDCPSERQALPPGGNDDGLVRSVRIPLRSLCRRLAEALNQTTLPRLFPRSDRRSASALQGPASATRTSGGSVRG